LNTLRYLVTGVTIGTSEILRPLGSDTSPVASWYTVSVALLALSTILLVAVGISRFLSARRQAHGKSGGAADAPVLPLGKPQAGSALRKALASCRSALLAAAVFSAFVNMLMITGSLFMMEVYDRVLPSRSLPTLVGLCIIAGILFVALGLLDAIRLRLLGRTGGAIDEALAGRVFDAVVRLPVRTGKRDNGLQPLRDLDAVRSFLSGLGPSAFFDLPWIPFYLAILFGFHPYLGYTALIGAIVLTTLTLVTEFLTRRPMRDSMAHGASRLSLAEACQRNSEVVTGMGLGPRLKSRWQQSNAIAVQAQQQASDVGGGLGAIARVLRMVLQSAVLAVGAYLVIQGEASAGIIIASSIVSSRALAPVDLAIGHWRSFVAARQGWRRLGNLLDQLPDGPPPMALPAPSDRIQVEALTLVPPGERRIVLDGLTFTLKSGQALGVIGPSGSGKTSLARSLVGAWLPARGTIRLDGATLDQWDPEELGRHVGYLPQDVELFAGTVAQNIARFDPNFDAKSVINAAKAADVHDLIVGLPMGYNTEIGEGGASLSAGQRQRIALARALYGDPFLVVLDEPDASLDASGERALQRALAGVRARGGILIVVSHRQMLLGAVDLLLALDQGRPLALGPKELVLQKLARPSPAPVHTLNVQSATN
jgi:PrtD family type I secretion system ABC transporter